MSIDDLIEELRAHAVGNTPELARLDQALRVLQTSDNPALIQDHDDMLGILRSPGPLIRRLCAVVAMLEQRLDQD